MEEDTQNPEPRCDFSAMEDEAGHNSDRYGYGVVGTALSGGCYAISLHFVTFASTLPSTGSGGPSIAPLLYFIFATLVTFVIGCLIALASAMFVFLMAAAFVYSLKIPVESKWIVAIAGGVYGVLPFVPTLVLQKSIFSSETSEVMLVCAAASAAVAYGTIGATWFSSKVKLKEPASSFQFGLLQMMIGTAWAALFTVVCCWTGASLTGIATAVACIVAGLTIAALLITLTARLRREDFRSLVALQFCICFAELSKLVWY